MKGDLIIEVLKPSGQAEAQDLIVIESIINGVEFSAVVDDVLVLFLYKILH